MTNKQISISALLNDAVFIALLCVAEQQVVSVHHTMKAYGGTDIALLFLNFGV
jgi:hypothetical protein